MTAQAPDPAPPRSIHDLRATVTRRRAELLGSVPVHDGGGEPGAVPLEGAGMALGRRNARVRRNRRHSGSRRDVAAKIQRRARRTAAGTRYAVVVSAAK